MSEGEIAYTAKIGSYLENKSKQTVSFREQRKWGDFYLFHRKLFLGRRTAPYPPAQKFKSLNLLGT